MSAMSSRARADDMPHDGRRGEAPQGLAAGSDGDLWGRTGRAARSTPVAASRALGVKPRTTGRNRSESSACSRTSLRGHDRRRSAGTAKQRDLPEALAGAEGRDDPAVADDVDLAGLDHVVAVADVALAEHHPARRRRRPARGRGPAARSRAAAACAASAPGGAARRRRRARPPSRPARRSRHHEASGQDRADQADADQGRAGPDALDHPGRGDRADPDGHRDQALQHPEDPGQHLVGRQPAEQGEAGDVDQRVADADEGEEDERRALLRHDADERERQPPQGDPDGEPRAEASGADEQRGRQRAEHGAHADGRHQRADPGLARCRAARSRPPRTARSARRG